MLTFSRVYSLTEVDLDRLFNESLPEMNNGTYVWGTEVNTDSLKYQHIRTVLNQLLVLGNAFMYKVVEDGVDISFIVATLDNGTLNTKLTFIGYNANASKSWVYYESTRLAREAFYNENGITSIIFNYTDASSFDTKVSTMLGSNWNTAGNIATDMAFERLTVLGFTATKA